MDLTKITIADFASWLDGRAYGSEITKEEERIAKEHGFVVVFGYSDDCAELRGAINDELGCFDGGILEHKDLPDTIYANWCPEDIDCSWAYGTQIPHEKFHIYDGGDLYCVGIVCDINKPNEPETVQIPCRCCECYHLLNSKNSFGVYFFCGHPNGLRNLKNTETDFCSYAERRPNG